MFYYGYKVAGDELFNVKRGIKLNKIRSKMKKST